MRCTALLLPFFVLLTSSTVTATSTPKRTIPCKTPANTNSCYWTRGRLRMGNGTPAYRLWKIGTHRQLGILSGPSKYDPDYPLFGRDLDNEAPEFPANVFRGLWNPAEPNGETRSSPISKSALWSRRNLALCKLSVSNQQKILSFRGDSERKPLVTAPTCYRPISPYSKNAQSAPDAHSNQRSQYHSPADR